MTNDPSPKPPSLLRNPVSLLGVAVASVSTAFGLPMMFIDMFSRRAHPYLAVLIYLVLPFVASGGVALILVGILWERRRRRRHPGQPTPPLPRIDLNQPTHQALVVVALTAIMVVVVLLSVTGYQAYHFTESVKFCGLVCHKVMKPEYTAYQHSPHARVACTQCHVGPGASWFVRSKITGAYQVYAVAFNKYPRPIATPIKNLRPAQETCEQCHWPAKFFGAQQKTFTHYLTDEANSPWQIQMLIKVGGGDPQIGSTAGIHWHMNISNEIEYIASDERREVIPWVRTTDREGRVTEYQSTEQPLSPEQIAAGRIRRMDCVDCHNRPSHSYKSPMVYVNNGMISGEIPKELPFIKKVAMNVLKGPFTDKDSAITYIRDSITNFYKSGYPAIFKSHQPMIEKAITGILTEFSLNVFPYMRASSKQYLNHIGHIESDGCFRCHSDRHKNETGKVISKDCDMCHTIIAQGPTGNVKYSIVDSLMEFQHPIDIKDNWKTYFCTECHRELFP